MQTLFSIPPGFNSPEVVELEAGMIVMGINLIKEASLLPFELVAESALDWLKMKKLWH